MNRRTPALAACALAVMALATLASRAQNDADIAALNTQASALDAADYAFVQPVCTRCHSPQLFLHSRSWSQWQGIFNQMRGYGAAATQEQWDRIYKYFQQSLTLIDVNHADEDELSAVLGVDEKTAVAMVQRRTDQRFQTAADVEAVPGVDKARIEAIRPRLLFDPVAEDQ